MKNALIVAAVAVFGVGASAMAADAKSQQGPYLGGQYNMVSYNEDNLDTIKPKAISVIAGWSFNPYFSLEARVGVGAGSDTFTYSGSDFVANVDVKVSSYASALLRGTLPINDSFNVYGLLGFTTGKLKATNRFQIIQRSTGAVVASGSAESSNSDSSVSFGLGAEVSVAGHSGVSLEWGRLVSGDGYDADAISLGYRYRF